MKSSCMTSDASTSLTSTWRSHGSRTESSKSMVAGANRATRASSSSGVTPSASIAIGASSVVPPAPQPAATAAATRMAGAVFLRFMFDLRSAVDLDPLANDTRYASATPVVPDVGVVLAPPFRGLRPGPDSRYSAPPRSCRGIALFPLRDENPTELTPYFTGAFIAIDVNVWVDGQGAR